MSDDDPRTHREDNGGGDGDDPAPRSTRRNLAPLGWYLLVLLVILVTLGWIPALVLVLTTLCVGFILTQQKREERR